MIAWARSKLKLCCRHSNLPGSWKGKMAHTPVTNKAQSTLALRHCVTKIPESCFLWNISRTLRQIRCSTCLIHQECRLKVTGCSTRCIVIMIAFKLLYGSNKEQMEFAFVQKYWRRDSRDVAKTSWVKSGSNDRVQLLLLQKMKHDFDDCRRWAN